MAKLCMLCMHYAFLKMLVPNSKYANHCILNPLDTNYSYHCNILTLCGTVKIKADYEAHSEC